MISDRELVFGVESVPKSGFLWCLHCERAYPYGSYRLESMGWNESDFRYFRKHGFSEAAIEETRKPLEMCPFPDCDGSTVLDGWDWDKVRKTHPDYPEVPELGVVYPLY